MFNFLVSISSDSAFLQLQNFRKKQQHFIRPIATPKQTLISYDKTISVSKYKHHPRGDFV